MLTKINGRLTMYINNNYFAPVIVRFVAAWILGVKGAKSPFLNETDAKQVFLADLPVRLTGNASCNFLYHFYSLPADSGTCVSNCYSHLNTKCSSRKFFLNKEWGTRKLNMVVFHTVHGCILLIDRTKICCGVWLTKGISRVYPICSKAEVLYPV